ncbi:hypothetical protein [Nannocystis pusilla]|uniref:hypothetical protein n=1 Tax=Nannocystis pusilla TaxID=889268 RepID=UPI003B81142D
MAVAATSRASATAVAGPRFAGSSEFPSASTRNSSHSRSSFHSMCINPCATASPSAYASKRLTASPASLNPTSLFGLYSPSASIAARVVRRSPLSSSATSSGIADDPSVAAGRKPCGTPRVSGWAAIARRNGPARPSSVDDRSAPAASRNTSNALNATLPGRGQPSRHAGAAASATSSRVNDLAASASPPAAAVANPVNRASSSAYVPVCIAGRQRSPTRTSSASAARSTRS